jgi:hypothetical protein
VVEQHFGNSIGSQSTIENSIDFHDFKIIKKVYQPKIESKKSQRKKQPIKIDYTKRAEQSKTI